MLVLFLFFLNVLFCSLYSLTFRLACSQLARATVCSRTFFAPPFVLLDYVFFCLLFIFVYLWKFLRIVCVCVLLSSFFFAHMGLNLSFPHRFSSSVEYKFALLTLSFKNFYIQSHCLPTFFCCCCCFFFADRDYYFTILRLDSSRILFSCFSRVKITVTFALRALWVNFCFPVNGTSLIIAKKGGFSLLFRSGKWECLWKKSAMEWFVPTFRCTALGVFVCFVCCICVSLFLLFSFCLWMIIE